MKTKKIKKKKGRRSPRERKDKATWRENKRRETRPKMGEK